MPPVYSCTSYKFYREIYGLQAAVARWSTGHTYFSLQKLFQTSIFPQVLGRSLQNVTFLLIRPCESI